MAAAQQQEPRLFEVKVTEYPLDIIKTQLLIPRLGEQLAKGVPAEFLDGENGDVLMRAVHLQQKDATTTEVYCFADAEPETRVRLDMNIETATTTAYVILTEEEAKVLQEAQSQRARGE